MKNKLTEQIKLRHGAILKNRIVMSPMQTSSGSKGGYTSDETVAYYSYRSKAAGLLITESHFVSENGSGAYAPGYPEQLGVSSDEHLKGLQRIADALKKDNNKAILQLQHSGIKGMARYIEGIDVVGPSSVEYLGLEYPIRELKHDEIVAIIKNFGQATKRAIDAGFDGVEIHGANHFLIQQFFSKLSNRRNDQWGGNFENRMKFPLEVVKEIKKVVNKYGTNDFIIGYRISPEEFYDGEVGYDYKESVALIKNIIKHELDYIHLSLPKGYTAKPLDCNQTYAEIYKNILDDDTKLIIGGGILNEKSALTAVTEFTDLIAVGRGILLDPNFGQKIVEGLGDTIINEAKLETINLSHLTTGLLEAFTRKDSLGLPPLPGNENISSLHSGKFETTN